MFGKGSSLKPDLICAVRAETTYNGMAAEYIVLPVVGEFHGKRAIGIDVDSARMKIGEKLFARDWIFGAPIVIKLGQEVVGGALAQCLEVRSYTNKAQACFVGDTAVRIGTRGDEEHE